MSAKSVIAGALAALSVYALSGCATSGGLAPSTHLVEADRLAASQTLSRAEAGQAWPAEQWWTSLGDPQLDRLIAVSNAVEA